MVGVGRARAGGETIGEVAAIARRAANRGEAIASISSSGDAGDRNAHDPLQSRARDAAPARRDPGPPPENSLPNQIPVRRTRAGAGLQKEPGQSASADKTAIHLILAGRAYAYGQRIVRKEEIKLGDLLAIKS
jgi:hypothetical protein